MEIFTFLLNPTLVSMYGLRYRLEARIFYQDMIQYFTQLGHWKDENPIILFRRLRFCGPPARGSISENTYYLYHWLAIPYTKDFMWVHVGTNSVYFSPVALVQMKVPLSVAQSMVESLQIMSRKYEEELEAFLPTSADGPAGHTPMSRDRFFQNQIESRDTKIGDYKPPLASKYRGSTYERYLAMKLEGGKGKRHKHGVLRNLLCYSSFVGTTLLTRTYIKLPMQTC